jgi:hypothetical protein
MELYREMTTTPSSNKFLDIEKEGSDDDQRQQQQLRFDFIMLDLKQKI